jgi:glycosyltransferase involved in cell wall biosynthesis
MMHYKQTYFDLTEAQLSASSRRIQYYGIARTVIESAKSAALLDPSVRFITFSFGHAAFFEVPCRRGPDGDVSFHLPYDIGQRWHRTHYGYSSLLSAVTRAIGVPITKRNRRLWDEKASQLKRVEILDGVIFSAGRPKLIVDMIKALKQAGSAAKFVPLLHDFMPLHIGATKRYRRFDRNFLHDNQYVISNSAGVITNSQFTKKELIKFADAKQLPFPEFIDPVPLVHQCPVGTEAPEITLPDEPYLLTVGLNLGRKNIEVVLASMNKLCARGETTPRLVIAGAHRKRLLRHVGLPIYAPIRERIVFINNPNQTDLVRLYTNALALVIPSRIEGWGLPAGEALWCGTPAICSTAPVLNEVCGDLGLYFSPDDPEALAGLVRNLINNPSYRDELRQRIASAKPLLRKWDDVSRDILSAMRKY